MGDDVNRGELILTARARLARMSSHLRDGWTIARRFSLPARRRAWTISLGNAIGLTHGHGRRALRRPLAVLNLCLVGVSTVLLVSVVRTLVTFDRLPPATVSRPGHVVAAPTYGRGPSPRASATNDLITARNLFDPSRSELTRASRVAQDAPPPAKPVLYGVVLSDEPGLGLAYLEDPATKRVSAYRVGDELAGARVERIERDRVQIRRAEGLVEVFLSGPIKPRAVEITPASGEPAGNVVPARRIPKD